MFYIDVNILMDVITRRDGWKDSIRILNDARNNKHDFGISALTVHILYFLIGNQNKGMADSVIREKIKTTIKDLGLLVLDSDIVNQALDSNFHDFEDAIQYETAKKHNCAVIITRNEDDFTKSTIAVWDPEHYFAMRS